MANFARYSISSTEIQFVGADILINGDDVIIKPISDIDKDNNKIYDVNTEDGWKSFGVCKDNECITEKLTTVAKELGEHGIGRCFDLRIKRTLLEARVFGRDKKIGLLKD